MRQKGLVGVLRSIRFYAHLSRYVFVNRMYDWRHRVNTSGTIRIGDLDVSSKNWEYGCDYAPTAVESGRAILASVEIDPSEYTFVDFGSGKGRMLFLASELDFKEIVGVEFARDLHALGVEPATRPGESIHLLGGVEAAQAV